MKHRIPIGENIRFIREQLGYSQEYVATQLGITQQSYSVIEKKPEKATLQRLKDIAAVLQVNFVTLLGEDDVYIQQNFHQQGGNAATQMNVSGAEKEIYEKFIEDLKEQVDFFKGLVKNSLASK